MTRSWRIYIILLTLFFAFVFEGVKSWTPKNPSTADGLATSDLVESNFQPFNAQSIHNQSTEGARKLLRKQFRQRINANKLVADATFAKNHSFDEGKKPKKKTKKKKKKTAEKDKKEKKKTAKLVEKDINQKVYDIEEDAPKEISENDAPINNDGLPPTGGGVPTPPSDNNIPQTFDEWAQLLLVSPDYKRTTEFIGLYQSQLIPDAVFYQVLEAMLEDNRQEMHLLAVRALGSTPSFMSFTLLTDILVAKVHSSTVNTLVRSQLELYTNINKLQTLKSVLLAKESSTAAIFAAQYLEKSAQRNLTSQVKQTDGQPSTLGNQRAVDPKSVHAYKEIADLLSRQLSSGDRDQEFSQYATAAISTINDLSSQYVASTEVLANSK